MPERNSVPREPAFMWLGCEYSWSDWAVWAKPSISKQIALLLHQPIIIIEVAINTLQLPNLHSYFVTFVGYMIQPYEKFPNFYYYLSVFYI